MIPAVSILCLVAGSIALPVNTDYYPKSQGYGGRRINGGFIGINSNGFESSILGFNGGNAAAAAASATSGLNSAAAAAAAANTASRDFKNGFDAELGLFGGNSAAAAASGMNAAAAASSAQRTSFNGLQGHSEHHLTGSSYGPFVHQVQSVQLPAVQQFPGLGGSAAAAAAAAVGRNAAAAAAAAAGQNAAAAAAASASGANFGSQIGIRGAQFAGQIGCQFVQPGAYYPNVVGQNSGSTAAAAAAATSNNAADAAAAASAASTNGFNGGIIGGSTGIIGSRFVPAKKY